MRMFELTQRLGFNLADPFARNRELLADFGKRPIRAHPDAEAQAQYALFAWAKQGEGPGSGLPQV